MVREARVVQLRTTPAIPPTAELFQNSNPVLDSSEQPEWSAGGTDNLIYMCLSDYHFQLSSDTYYHSSTGDSQAALSLVGPANASLQNTEPWQSQASSLSAFAASNTPMSATDAIVQNGNTIDGVSYYADWASSRSTTASTTAK